jgi:hypothetical protein
LASLSRPYRERRASSSRSLRTTAASNSRLLPCQRPMGVFTRRGGALRTKGKTQTWRYPDDPAVSLRHGPSGTPSGTPGRSNLGRTTGGLVRRHFVGEMAHNREAPGSRSRRNRRFLALRHVGGDDPRLARRFDPVKITKKQSRSRALNPIPPRSKRRGNRGSAPLSPRAQSQASTTSSRCRSGNPARERSDATNASAAYWATIGGRPHSAPDRVSDRTGSGPQVSSLRLRGRW